MGNIGKPCFDYIADMTEDAIAVFELSCHQCQRLQADPHVAVFLNLYEDHLDRYEVMDRYFDAKKGITKHQSEEDYLFLGTEVPALSTRAKVTAIDPGAVDYYDLRIPGEHNQFNSQFVYEIATKIYGCDGEAVKKALASFTGLPHRLQFAGKIDGIDYYDDSISTIPEATIQACNSVGNTKTVLVGGMDRGIEYDILIDFMREHQNLNFILAYASGKRIYEAVKELNNTWYVEDLDAQVRLAKEITPAGSAVIMSNAAASYGYFKNFEDRGDYFKQIIVK